MTIIQDASFKRKYSPKKNFERNKRSIKKIWNVVIGIITVVTFIFGVHTQIINRLKVSLYKDFRTVIPNYLLPDQSLIVHQYFETFGTSCINFPIANTLVLYVKNLSYFDEIQVVDTVIFKLESFDLFPADPINISILGMGGGGPLNFYNFLINIDSKPGNSFHAEYDPKGQSLTDFNLKGDRSYLMGIPSSGFEIFSNDQYTYFNFDERDVEFFAVDVRFNDPGVYKFRVGLKYLNNSGKEKELWLKDTFTAIVPEKMIVWQKINENDEFLYKKYSSCVFREFYMHEQSYNIFDSYECEYFTY